MLDIPEVLVFHLPLQVLLAPLELCLMFLTDRSHCLSPLLHVAGEDLPEGGIKLVGIILADLSVVLRLREVLDVLEVSHHPTEQ